MATKRQSYFLALPLSEAFAHNLALIQNHIDHNLRLLNIERIITPTENLHVTVIYLGTLDPSKRATVEFNLKTALNDVEPIILTPEKIILAPLEKEKSMIWLTYEDNETFSVLRNRLISALNLPFTNDPRQPIIHTTLFRIKKPLHNLDINLPEVEMSAIKIKAVTLFHSKHQNDTRIYTPIETYPILAKTYPTT